jgi:hypothetical protein
VQRIHSDVAAAACIAGLQPARHLIGEHDVGKLALT